MVLPVDWGTEPGKKKEAIDCIEKLRSESSLYLTSDPVKWAKGELQPNPF
jgi:hypothetical protein